MPDRPFLLFGISRRLQISAEVPRTFNDFSTFGQSLRLKAEQRAGNIIVFESSRQCHSVVGGF